MFAGVSCFEKSGHHDLYKFRPLCHNENKRLKAARPPSRRLSGLRRVEMLNAGVKQELRGRSVKICVNLWPFPAQAIPSAFQKCRIKGGRKISDNPKNFGNISEKQPFSEKISDLFFWGRGVVWLQIRGGSASP
jgi:hypothetical protein